MCVSDVYESTYKKTGQSPSGVSEPTYKRTKCVSGVYESTYKKTGQSPSEVSEPTYKKTKHVRKAKSKMVNTIFHIIHTNKISVE